MVTAKDPNLTQVDYILRSDEEKITSKMPISIALEIINRCGAKIEGDEILVRNMVFFTKDFSQ